MRRDSFAAFASVKGPDICGRLGEFAAWTRARIEGRSWSFGRVARPVAGEYPTGLVVRVTDAAGQDAVGYNFAAQDYLGLAAHPAVRDFLHSVLDEYGPHSAGSDPNLGNHAVSELLKSELAAFLDRAQVVLFPTGWGAAYGALRATARPRDHVLLDRLAHNCLVSGARAATPKVGFFAHNSVADLRDRLRAIRATDATNAVLVVSESLFSMDADGPDLAGLVAACREHDAHLVLDVAHDLGAGGEQGRGLLETATLGEGDLIVGTFSKTFCTTGGFVATPSAALATYIRAFGDANTFSNTLSPLAAGAALAALRVVVSDEGAALRRRLAAVSARLVRALQREGLTCLGSPSAVIPVLIGGERLGRRVCNELVEAGLVTNFMEYPAVPVGRSRLRLQVSPAHEALPLERCAARLAATLRAALGGDLTGVAVGAGTAARSGLSPAHLEAGTVGPIEGTP